MSRPYRSHKVPACDACRRRKARCTVDIAGEDCLLCRLHNRSCLRSTHTSIPAPSPRPPIAATIPSARLSRAEDRITTREDQVDHVLAPGDSQDVQALDHALAGSEESNVLSAGPATKSEVNRPVLFQQVLRRREGLPLNGTTGLKPADIIEQVLAPHLQELVDLYFEKIHPCFPVLNKDVFQNKYRNNKNLLSQALLCCIYCITLPYWQSSPSMRPSPHVDLRFAWNMAVSALQSEFLEPTIATVQAAILDLAGRPVFSMIGNELTRGRTISLAQSLGLNRNPGTWPMDMKDKVERIHLWQAVYIHDCWSSLAHGTPPQLNKSYSDISMTGSAADMHGTSTSAVSSDRTCFPLLCQLTGVLGETLPLIYNLHQERSSQIAMLTCIESQYNVLEIEMAEFLNLTDANQEVPGLSNLRLAAITVKLCLCRISLQIALPALRSAALLSCRKAAETLVDFVISLTEHNLQEFWLPYNAYHIRSATTLLFRCALETRSNEIINQTIGRVENLMNALRYAKAHCNWDIGDICLEQCSPLLQRILSAYSTSSNTIRSRNPVESNEETQLSSMPCITDTTDLSDLFMDFNGMDTDPLTDFLWPDLWDSTQTGQNSST